MGLTKRLARDVANDVRARGRQYYASGVVRILQGDEQQVRAEVEGTELYRVGLFRKRKALQVCCSCPYYQDRGVPCKHIWATVLTADEKGHLRGPHDRGPLFLRTCNEEALVRWVEEGLEKDPRRFAPRPEGNGRHERNGRRVRRRWERPPREAPQRQDVTEALADVQNGPLAPVGARLEPWPAGREVVYIVDVAATQQGGRGLAIEIGARQRKKEGGHTRARPQRFPMRQIPLLPEASDREVLSLLTGAREEDPEYGTYGIFSDAATPARYRLPWPAQEVLLSHICATGRCLVRRTAEDEELHPLRWDDGPPWEFWLRVRRDEAGANYVVAGELRRGEERRMLAEPVLLVMGGLVFWQDTAARLQDFGAYDLVPLLRQQGLMAMPVTDRDRLLRELLSMPRLPRLDLPPELHFEEVAVTPRPRLRVEAPQQVTPDGSWERMNATLSFDYEGEVVQWDQAGRGVYQSDRRRFLLRDSAAETRAMDRLLDLGFRPPPSTRPTAGLELTPRALPKVVPTLLQEGWHVEAEGKVYRRPGGVLMSVTSNTDWFELRGGVDFDGKTASLPDLLAALRRGESMVRLDDGSFGMLPEEWLKKYGSIAALGKAEGDHLRFGRSQAGLLDALVSSQPNAASCDPVFNRVREELHAFAGIEATDPPAGFAGLLRGYQREGLGWLNFLEKFSFGGCLADDMGLGKTVQVLALLESRRWLRAATDESDRPPPSLVIVPRSLVFNWKEEASRFTPELRVLEHSGAGRLRPGKHFHDYDVILTTYGTLRRDVREFKDFHFDYCVLDEAQAIKNAQSESARAARQLHASHRLALSGTPVENHLGELWSLFEFLNPGMLGSVGAFQSIGGRNPDEQTRALLARALRPFILRRTKEQVAKDLPAKSEQTIHCEMEPAQRRLYDELRDHYRDSLLARVAKEGMQRARMHVLEALLRLRQAACHPGLIDPKRAADPSAKLDALMAQIEEILDEGHKALIFSQFTKLLAIVRQRLDQDGIVYEYLDGRTRDRQAKVERFQQDTDCKLFLISLKAGGLGLNLTAAEYVFLLDPWWNPAVEAQAMDRAHRIGQTKPVFAYRLIAQDTVEEKILQLQKSKRALADAIINADNSLIRNLSRDDLELLLS